VSSGPLHEFMDGFVSEADAHLESSRAALLAIDEGAREGQARPREVRTLMRAMHTIKGLAGMVGAEAIEDLAHALESVLRAGEHASGRLPVAAIEPLLEGLRALEQRIQRAAKGEGLEPAPRALLDALASIALATERDSPPDAVFLDDPVFMRLTPSEREELAQAGRGGRTAVRIDFVPSQERSARGLTIASVRDRLSKRAEIVRVVPLHVPESPHAPGGLCFAMFATTADPLAAVAESVGLPLEAVSRIAFDRSGDPLDPLEDDISLGDVKGVRVTLAKLDAAMETLSELIVTRFRLERSVADLQRSGVDVRDLRHVLADNARQLRDMRAAVLALRLVPATQVLEPLRLVVRSLEASSKKRVALALDAGHVELDKSVAERLFQAIIHLARNAVDHGLEAPDERLRAGKPEKGTISVTCAERSNARLAIYVSDDGRGIDAELVARRAGRPVPSNDAELLELLATPGLTTRDAVTKISGRGFGVDIAVRTVIEELGGEISLENLPGRGTRWVIEVPQTLTIVDAFRFECSDQAFVVPVSMVEEIVEVTDTTWTPSLAGHGMRLMLRRGRPIPVVALEDALDLPASRFERRKAFVVRRPEGYIAFEVDRLLDHQEIVVRPLEDALVKVNGIAGSTDLGNGRPTLLLDLMALARRLDETATLAEGGP
jgi:two-component system, chemotaxis family, sensor kinase CheA